MANVQLHNADNVDCFYAGQTISLFMNLRRPSAVVAQCADSTVEDVPIVFRLILQRENEVVAHLPTSSRGLIVRRQPERGVGADVVSFAVEGRDLLKVTVDLAQCFERSRQLSSRNLTLPEHVLVNQTWMINEAFTLLLQLRSTAHATWPALPGPQWNEMLPSSTFSQPPVTPRSSSHRRDVSESVYLPAEDSLAQPLSTASSMASRTTRLFNPSEPRSQLQRALFVDQTLFPIIRVYFVPELFTRPIATPPNMLWNMSLQITVEKNAARKPRRTAGRERVPKREPRRHGETLNLAVEESVLVSSVDWGEEEVNAPRQVEAIAFSFNADYRDRLDSNGRDGDGDVCDVARASRLVVDDFTFSVLVTAKKQAGVKVEEIMRTVYSYCSERGDVASVLDVNLDDLTEYIYDRYAFMKTTPYFDGLSFHNTVGEAVVLYFMNNILTGEDYDVDVDDGALLMDGVLASA
ncbi:hypothetical protein ABB37_01799 [Leptomonas pyrrhocoris]|uniref:Uncharacterized protein n=1 Tax=Leptomonas pyrrhocoris TaxID=157538 RepID=A0A0N0DZP0_LEPPY|nr:hypothetical protein ABB37_01799 [Leptomonas pyrrhocoris]KPA85525.1 hypothetical protein ABB37_01799 [Leptomonas pyrrhocoris]|eukprot:XP_015663964.1 hypothetical protein ABB37_01799 [Leptomonas pyrrhocoris]